MSKIVDIYSPPAELVLGTRLNSRVHAADQKRQRCEVEEALIRLRRQPGVILADEVGMGKTYVALSIAYSIASRSPLGPVIIMVPANLTHKWEQDLKAFCELYLDRRIVLKRGDGPRKEQKSPFAFFYGVARHSIDLLRMLDDPRNERCQMIFLTHGALGRGQTDKWVRLALIAECLRRHARGGASHLIKVKQQIHRFLAELIWARGEERASDWGEELWKMLLHSYPETWRETFNRTVREEQKMLQDDPVPKAIIRVINQLELKDLILALERMPVRARGGEDRISERIDDARTVLRGFEKELWKILLNQARWRSPLLVMDEAHHLKNPATSLARQLQWKISLDQLRIGDGAMAQSFDRMLFLTATPFQLGHSELIHVLQRFGDIRWDKGLGEVESFNSQMNELEKNLSSSQRTIIALQKAWRKLRPTDCDEIPDTWWNGLTKKSRIELNHRQRAVLDAFEIAYDSQKKAEESLRPWILRHNKGEFWNGTEIVRRCRIIGSEMSEERSTGGIMIPPQQLLPFFLAARSSVHPKKDLLGEALSSSYEAFRLTRKNKVPEKDEQDDSSCALIELPHTDWYLQEFDRSLDHVKGIPHPKMDYSVKKVADLWEKGEKVLVFAFYRHTCRALRRYISEEIGKRTTIAGVGQFARAGKSISNEELKFLIQRVQDRFFDNAKSPGRRSLDAALNDILATHNRQLEKNGMTDGQRAEIINVMRRFLRVGTTIARFFPLVNLDSLSADEIVREVLECTDVSNMSWHDKFDGFIEFLYEQCITHEERELYIKAAHDTETGAIRIQLDENSDGEAAQTASTLPNVQVATGSTPRDARVRLMHAFNTPFFPEILVCSEVMGEGVDLQRHCRHVIHHDLAWNPSTIEQRTGRIDRLGCKAEGRHPILMYLPYLAGAADERQFKVMSDREQWFRFVMGEKTVEKLISEDSVSIIPLPRTISEKLSFKLGIEGQ